MTDTSASRPVASDLTTVGEDFKGAAGGKEEPAITDIHALSGGESSKRKPRYGYYGRGYGGFNGR